MFGEFKWFKGKSSIPSFFRPAVSGTQATITTAATSNRGATSCTPTLKPTVKAIKKSRAAARKTNKLNHLYGNGHHQLATNYAISPYLFASKIMSSITLTRKLRDIPLGAVYLARLKNDTRLHEVKVFRKNDLVVSSGTGSGAANVAMDQLRHECAMLRKAADYKVPFVKSFVASFQTTRHVFMVTTHAGGGSVKDYDGTVSENRAKVWAAQTLLALQGLHEAGLIHRGLSANEVRIGVNGDIMLSAFGATQEKNSSAGFNILPSSAPTASSSSAYEADVWGYGELVSQLLTGHMTNRVHNCLQEWMENRKTAAGADARLFGCLSKVSTDAIEILVRTLHYNPERRVQEMSELRKMAWFKDIDWSCDPANSFRFARPSTSCGDKFQDPFDRTGEVMNDNMLDKFEFRQDLLNPNLDNTWRRLGAMIDVSYISNTSLSVFDESSRIAFALNRRVKAGEIAEMELIQSEAKHILNFQSGRNITAK